MVFETEEARHHDTKFEGMGHYEMLRQEGNAGKGKQGGDE